jgi:hypothetical protein
MSALPVLVPIAALLALYCVAALVLRLINPPRILQRMIGSAVGELTAGVLYVGTLLWHIHEYLWMRYRSSAFSHYSNSEWGSMTLAYFQHLFAFAFIGYILLHIARLANRIRNQSTARPLDL